MKILIVGGGISGKRFVESYFFDEYNLDICGLNINGKAQKLAEKYKLNYFNISELKLCYINKYDCIIISTPPESRSEILNKIISLKYKNKLIIEKPFALNIEEAKQYVKLLKNNDFEVCYSRRFEPCKYKIKKSIINNYTIIWPVNINVISKETNYIHHLLPHIIDWILMNFKIDATKVKIEKISNSHFTIKYKKNTFKIYFINVNSDEKVSINGIHYDWPNYIKINHLILDSVLNNHNKTKHDILNNAIILEKAIKEDMYE